MTLKHREAEGVYIIVMGDIIVMGNIIVIKPLSKQLLQIETQFLEIFCVYA